MVTFASHMTGIPPVSPTFDRYQLIGTLCEQLAQGRYAVVRPRRLEVEAAITSPSYNRVTPSRGG